VPRPEDIVNRVRRALATRDLTLYQVSRDSARIFGRSSPYFIPEHFYADLTGRAVSPSIHQFAALSRVSNYCLADWLALFGIILDDISRLQMLLPHRRTILLDASVYDDNEWIPWFAPRPRTASLSAISPLSEVLKPGPKTRARDLLALNTRQFLYAKVGREDFFAFPDLAPGSVARIDVLDTAHFVSTLTHLPTPGSPLTLNRGIPVNQRRPGGGATPVAAGRERSARQRGYCEGSYSGAPPS
jgi:hypothetical protein